MLTTGKGTHYCVYCGYDMKAKEERLCVDCDGDVCKPKKRESKKAKDKVDSLSNRVAVLEKDLSLLRGQKLCICGKPLATRVSFSAYTGCLHSGANSLQKRVATLEQEFVKLRRAFGDHFGRKGKKS